MPRAEANGIEIEYESMGTGEPLLLVMGIGAQLVMWPDGFCRMLADRGFRVIRFDNRDVGLSSKLHDARAPALRTMLLRGIMGLRVEAPYTLSDMADDTAGLLDALDIDRAHVVGVSLGGMIAQTMAIVHPTRLRTLVSIMSHTGSFWRAPASPRALRVLLSPPPRDAAEAGQRYLEFLRATGSRGFPIDESAARARAARAFERCTYPRGFIRQLAALVATGDRTAALRFVRTPTLVVHGTDDALIPPSGGKATARAIPGARLRLIQGMGHDLPEGAWPVLADAIAEHARQSRGPAARTSSEAASA
jgi:pimeloyl-ACP methyl ester carboxylesterase